MSGRSRLNVAPAELILVPLLDMISLLVQVLLLNIQFGVFAELPARQAGAGGAEGEADLALTIDIEARGFALRWNEAGGARAELLPCVDPCRAVEHFPYARLGEVLSAIKEQHPAEQRVLVRPLVDLPFEVIARTMDEARGGGGQGRFTDVGLGGRP
jgi:hypothetical protein